MTAGNGKHPSCLDLHVLRSSRSMNLFFKKDAAREEMRQRYLHRLLIIWSCRDLTFFFFFSSFLIKSHAEWSSCGGGGRYHLTCSHIDIDWSVFSIYKDRKSALAKLQFPLLSSKGHYGPPQSSCIFIKEKKLIYFPTSSIESVPLIKLIQKWLSEFCPVKDTDY